MNDRDHGRRSATTALGVGLATLLYVAPAAGQSLEDALAQAYMGNPTLEAQRAQLRATDELVPQALSGYRPNAEISAEYGIESTESRTQTGTVDRTTHPAAAALSVTQPLYRGGRTVAATERAESLVQAQRAALLSAEQEILLDAVVAYLDVVRDQAVVELNVNNVQVLQRQLDAFRDRFSVGEITRTDVSQAEARLARSLADRIQAEGLLQASRAVFTRVVGSSPGELDAPTPEFQLPGSLDETVTLAQENNPSVVASQYSEQAALGAVDQVRGELLPEIGVQGALSRSWEPQSSVSRADGASITAQVRIPLYQAGVVSARVREAKHTAGQRRIEIEETRRQVREAAIRAWEALTTARAAIRSRQSQVDAAEIALEGVRQEAVVGARTTLDVLDAEQELLDARVELVRSQRDETAAAFQVLAAIGQLTARQLGLPVEYYDPEIYYNEVRGKWYGTGIPQ
ncbi:MAG TPA: TolC family outer membrane protein [Arenibaculum sp.]|nr:TolC family outer membrane protein [Arenibaculum sp.]